MYGYGDFYDFVKIFFCKPQKLFSKKLLTFFTAKEGVIKPAGLLP